MFSLKNKTFSLIFKHQPKHSNKSKWSRKLYPFSYFTAQPQRGGWREEMEIKVKHFPVWVTQMWVHPLTVWVTVCRVGSVCKWNHLSGLFLWVNLSEGEGWGSLRMLTVYSSWYQLHHSRPRGFCSLPDEHFLRASHTTGWSVGGPLWHQGLPRLLSWTRVRSTPFVVFH